MIVSEDAFLISPVYFHSFNFSFTTAIKNRVKREDVNQKLLN